MNRGRTSASAMRPLKDELRLGRGDPSRTDPVVNDGAIIRFASGCIILSTSGRATRRHSLWEQARPGGVFSTAELAPRFLALARVFIGSARTEMLR